MTQIHELHDEHILKQQAHQVLTPDTNSHLETRSHWNNRLEFMLSCLGYSVGLGNIWRFPYLCMQMGGGAFLVPYILFLCICGVPLFFMECTIGQLTGLSTIRLFNLIPIFSGLGWCMIAASAILSVYYNIIVAWVLYYLAMSFQSNLPWEHCNNTWNKENCFNYGNISKTLQNNTDAPETAAEQFWRFGLLQMTDNIEINEGMNWKLCVAFIMAWLLTFICMIKGIRSTGKVVYVTVTAPYILLTIILVRGVTLPGSWDGIKLFIVPKWSHLLKAEVWSSAATQVFYSLGPAWGGLITFGSYNKFNHNVMRDSIVIPLLCGATSVFGGFAIFSVIGHMIHITLIDGNIDVDQFLRQGPGLTFITYPQALRKLPYSPVWCVLFFTMLLTLGIDSQFTTLEAVITGLTDQFPTYFNTRRIRLTFSVCLIEFLLGLVLVTRAGIHYFNLLDNYATAFSVVVIGFLESIVIAYFYGAKRLLNDTELMIGTIHKYIKRFWTMCWLIFVPVMIFTLIVITIIGHFDGGALAARYGFPNWSLVLGWAIALCSLIEFPVFAIYAIWKYKCNWHELFTPSTEWAEAINHRLKSAQFMKPMHVDE